MADFDPLEDGQIYSTATDGESGDILVRPSDVAWGQVQCELGSGDVIVLRGRVDRSATMRDLVTFNATSDPPADVSLPRELQCVRTTDGGSDSIVYIDLIPARK